MRTYVVDYQYLYDGDKNAYDGTQIFLADGLLDLYEQWQLFSEAISREIPDMHIAWYEIVEDIEL